MPKKRKMQARKKQPTKKARPLRHRTKSGDPLTEHAVKEDINRYFGGSDSASLK
ncbi:MAG: hypothetical protein KIS67_01790 [Verrucomicrobiae bacterium]|nr:hypothetical protein [Verrucomicrobiae bacterium]